MEPTPADIEAADRVDLVYQYALAQLGAKTTAEVLALWQGVPVGKAAETASQWLSAMTAAILTNRSKARELGIAYYRVARALRTGATVANPLKPEREPQYVSLEMLRQEFEALVAEITGEGSTEVNASEEPRNEDDSVEVERIGFGPSLADDDAATPPYTETYLGEMADVASRKVEDIDQEMSNADAKAKAKELHAQSGAMVAGAASRIAMNGARNATNQASARDPRVIGWVRQHGKSDDPCYFCSMMISRRVLYKSQSTAGAGQRADGRMFLGDGLFKYHDNCHCTAEPVYSDADFGSNPKYAQNRKYAALWDKHIKDKYSGDDAINEWRKLLRRIRADEKRTATQAVAA